MAVVRDERVEALEVLKQAVQRIRNLARGSSRACEISKMADQLEKDAAAPLPDSLCGQADAVRSGQGDHTRMSDFRPLCLAICVALCLSACAYADKELATTAPLASNAAQPVPESGTTQIGSAQPFGADERPFVTIHSESADVDYERPLSAAVQAALQRKPSATFLVQGAIPASNSAGLRARDANAAKEGVEKVFQSLQSMGLPADRISVSVATLPMLEDGEIRVYVQ